MLKICVLHKVLIVDQVIGRWHKNLPSTVLQNEHISQTLHACIYKPSLVASNGSKRECVEAVGSQPVIIPSGLLVNERGE